MFNSFRAGRLRGRPMAPPIIRFMLGVFLCAALWVAAHYRFGSYFDRVHSGGRRIYRVNSYEQFMKKQAGGSAFLMA